MKLNQSNNKKNCIQSITTIFLLYLKKIDTQYNFYNPI